ncbi:MAG: hypothetical protein AAFR61_02100 [Bacteroidota bacterium]
MKLLTRPFLLMTMLLLGLVACKPEVTNPDPEPGPDPNPNSPSTWQVIQEDILDQQCTSCHVEGNSFALQSDLILTADVAYSQLINKDPKNEAAKADGLVRLGTKGLESLYQSFLWEKINAPDIEHFQDDHPGYGEIMPLGGQFLTNGEINFIKKWILEGAPEEGVVADVSLLDDTSRFVPPPSEFTALPMPASGYQIHLGPFDVDPNYEREFYYYYPLNNPEPIYVNKLEIDMRRGSHHFLLYEFDEGAATPTPNTYRDLRDQNGVYQFPTLLSIQDQVYIYGTQWRRNTYEFPDGVALRMPANMSLDLNPHYVNRTNEKKIGEVYTNLHTIPASEVQHVADNLFLNNGDIELPPQKTTTLNRTWTFNEARNIFLLTSHAHERMTEFRIFIHGGSRGGELIFYTNDWEHPPLLEFDPPIQLKAGEGLRAQATYHNDTNETLRFGLLSTDEMMIIFGAYYR